MKTFHKELWFNIPERMGFINITSDVKTAVNESGIRDGLCLVNAMHITASVFINDDESGLHEDYKRWLEEIAPFDPSPENTIITEPERTMVMLTINGRLWAERWWWL